MGGPSGGSSGGAGPAGRKKDGTYGTAKDAKKTSRRNEGRKALKEVGDFIKGGGVTGAIVRGISKSVKKSKEKKAERKANESLLGTSDYQGDVAKKPAAPMNTGSGDGGNNNSTLKKEVTQKSIEQPKVKSQMDNTDVKSKEIIADKVAPTETNATDTKSEADEILLKNKRKGRKRTVLTSVSGVEGYPTLSRRTLLGG